MGALTRIALLTTEPLRPVMAGIGIRYLELARHLPRPGIEVVLLTSGDLEEVPAEGLPVADVRRFDAARMAEQLADCNAVVAQGQLANDLAAGMPSLPLVIDLYDPVLLENLHYAKALGLGPYRNDHASWMLQLARGDFFLCSCEEQRLYYLGLLTALGRVNPSSMERDGAFSHLIGVVPFGVPDALPEHRPILPARAPGERRILFGGLYDWYDPFTALEALARLDRPELTLLFSRNPNLASTPQVLLAEVESWCRQRGWWGTRVQLIDWVPASRRFDLLRDVDALLSTHRPSLEVELSLRTRFLDALAAGCPVMSSSGGAISRLLTEHDAGWVVPPGDAAALATAIGEVVEPGADRAPRRQNAQRLLEAFRWERVLEPLVRFCREPMRDASKELFALPRAAAPEPAPVETPARGLLQRLLRD